MYVYKKESELDMKRCNEMFRGGGNLEEKTTLEASKSVSNVGGVGTPPYVAKSVSCRHSNADLHKKVAFTLAEVLITLGIIGVVAALTIPNVVSNYKKKVVETRLAQLYSVLNQAVELSEEKKWGLYNLGMGRYK